MKSRTTASLLLVIAASAALAFGPAHAQAPAAPQVSVAKPVVKEIMEIDDYIGRFEAASEVDIRARVQGYLDKVHFTDGAMVKAGDLLFTIDQRPYTAALEQAQASVDSAQSRLEFASNDLERAESLRKTGNISEQLLDQRRQNFLTARADLDRAKAAQRDAALNLEFTEIRAPIDGRISRRLVTVGNLVNANQTVLTNIVSTDPIHFYFDVDERAYTAYARMARDGERPSGRDAGHKVSVSFTDRRVAPLTGRLDFVDNRLDPQSGTMRGRAVFPNHDGIAVPGMFGRIAIPGSGLYRGVLIPDEAIASDQDRRIVYVVNPDNTVRQQAVRPGPRIDGYRVIRSGLTGEETIVVNGLTRVRPGATITPRAVTLPPTRNGA